MAGATRLTRITRLADPDPWRNRLRELVHDPSNSDRLIALNHLAKSARVEDLAPASLDLLGVTLLEAGDPTRAEKVLREAQQRIRAMSG